MIPALASVCAECLKLNGIHFADFRAQGFRSGTGTYSGICDSGSVLVLAVLTVLLISVKPGKKAGGFQPGAGRACGGPPAAGVTGAELGANARLFWQDHMDDSQALYMEYSKGLQKQLAQLRAVDGGYYRIAQDRTRWHYTDQDDLTAYFNDSLAQNYWSNTAYTSSPDKAQLDLMWKLGYRDEAGCMMIVRDPVLPSDSFLGVRYYLESTPVRGLEPVDGVAPFNGRTVYRNPYALPMAFTYDGSKLPTMNYSSTFAYQNQLFSILSGKETEIYIHLFPGRGRTKTKSPISASTFPKGIIWPTAIFCGPKRWAALCRSTGQGPSATAVGCLRRHS